MKLALRRTTWGARPADSAAMNGSTTAQMLDAAYLETLAKKIDMKARARSRARASRTRGGTVVPHHCRRERGMNAVVHPVETTRASASGVVVPGTGIAPAESRAPGFVLKPGHPNPGRAPPQAPVPHEFIPGFLTRNGQPGDELSA